MNPQQTFVMYTFVMLGANSHTEFRSAKRSDAAALVDVFTHSWRHAYTGIIPHDHLDIMIRRRNENWWHRSIRSGNCLSVLEFDDKIVGYCSYGAARNHRIRKHKGEIYELYLEPTYQGLGFGEMMFEGCRNALDQRRLQGLMLWALADNTMALDFYWRRGGCPIAQTVDRFGRVKLEKIAMAWN